MATVRLNGDASGYVELKAPNAAGSNSLILPTGNGTASQYLQTDGAGSLVWNHPFRLTQGTAKASTSGTSIDFSPADNTGIPSWAKRITVMFDGVSMNTTVNWLIQIGDSGGIENTGYVSASEALVDTPSSGGSNSTAGFIICGSNALLGDVYGGAYVLTNLTGNTWCLQGTLATTTSSRVFMSAGSKTLSDTLDRVRITSTTGTPTFDAGTINIMWEG